MPVTVTTQPALSPQLFHTADDVKGDILAKWDAEQAFCLPFTVRPDSLNKLMEMFGTFPGAKNLRISYTEVEGLIVRWMPGHEHETASRGFVYFILDNFSRIVHPKMYNALFIPQGSTRREIRTPNKEFKEPDESFVPVGATSPSVILEIGASEHLAQLQTDAHWWLTSTALQVKLVILLSIAPPPLNSAIDEPTITLEHWQMVESGCHGCRAPLALFSVVWTDTVPGEGEYELLTEAFVPDSALRAQYNLPDKVVPDIAAMRRLREIIIIGWRQNHATE